MSTVASDRHYPEVLIYTKDGTITLLPGEGGFTVAADSGEDSVVIDPATLALIARLTEARDNA